MADRVLCEIVTDEFTGIEYPTPYSGNCFFTSDSKALQEFKKEVLTDHPELKGKLKIVSVKSMDVKRNSALALREKSRAYQEWRAYMQQTTRGWMG